MFRPARTLYLALLTALVTAGGFVRPQEVQACVWVPSHQGSPFPPCPWEDPEVWNRIRQANKNLLGKVLSAVGKIHYVKREIKGWLDAYETAKGYKETLYQYYGQLTANPLPALVAEYNRQSPLAQYIRLSTGDGWTLVANPLDIDSIADEVWSNVNNKVGLGRFYNFRDSLIEVARAESDFTANRAMKSLREITDHRAYMETVSDSLRKTANSISSRYANLADPAGLAEAEIQKMSAYMNRLNGTAFEAQSRGVVARLEAFNKAVRERQIEIKRDARYREIQW